MISKEASYSNQQERLLAPIAAENPPPRKRGDEISLIDLLIALVKRRRFIFLTTLVFAASAAIVSLLLPKLYTASVAILPPQQNSSAGASLLAGQLGSMGGMAALAGSSLGLKNPNDMLVAMMKSRTVEDGMVQRFGLMQEYHSRLLSDARKSLEHYAAIDGSGKDGLIRISYEDADPKRAAELANGYVDEFRKLSEHLAISEAAQRRMFFEQQLQGAKNNLANAEEALKETEQRTGMLQLDSQARALIESAASLRAQIAAKEVEIQSLETFATDQNAQLVQAQRELDSLRSQLGKLGESENAGETSLILPKGKVPQAGLEYLRRVRDIKYYETIFDILARQFEIAKLDEAREGALIQVVDQAVPPDRRSFPKRALIVAGATITGLFCAVLAALLKEWVARLGEDAETGAKVVELKRHLSLRNKTG